MVKVHTLPINFMHVLYIAQRKPINQIVVGMVFVLNSDWGKTKNGYTYTYI